MNGAHLHLLLNHVSLFALFIGTVLFAISMKRKSTELRTAASVLFVIVGIFGWIAVETGEKAYDILKPLGLLDPDSFVNQHAAAADWAQRSGILIAVLAIILEWAARKKQRWVKAIQWILLVAAIHGCTVFARTAYLGGLVRHTEIR